MGTHCCKSEEQEQTIENAGKGLFCSKNFELGETVIIFMGRKLTSEELCNNDFSIPVLLTK